MNGYQRVLDAVLSSATPTAEQSAKITKLAEDLMNKTRSAAAKHPEVRGVALGGSLAKGTWLSDHVDIDIFLRIDPSTPEARFEKVGLEVGAAACRGLPKGKKFAQHPYTEAWAGGTRVNIVPCYDVQEKGWKSAADRSLFHVDLVKNVREEMKLEIRLLKMFMIGVGTYGAEIEVQGFSGYIAEVLVLEHKTLLGVLRYFSRLKGVEGQKLLSLPDPVDEGRDLATAVSREKLGTMILASREFLNRPRKDFFTGVNEKGRPGMRKRVVGVIFSHKPLSEDILWGELRKTTRHVVRHAEVKGFKIARSIGASNNSNRSAILLIPEFTELPELEQKVGPTVDRNSDVEAFLKSNRAEAELVWVDQDARVRVLRPRSQRSLVGLLDEVASGETGSVGASKELGAGLRRTGVVLSGDALSKRGLREGWLGDGIKAITRDGVGTG